MAKNHEELCDLIRFEASQHGHRLWSVRPVKGYQGKKITIMYKGRLVKALVDLRYVSSDIPDGTPDLVGFTLKKNYPIFTGIEVKVGRDKLKKHQALTGKMLQGHGCVWGCVRSVEEYLNALK